MQVTMFLYVRWWLEATTQGLRGRPKVLVYINSTFESQLVWHTLMISTRGVHTIVKLNIMCYKYLFLPKESPSPKSIKILSISFPK